LSQFKVFAREGEQGSHTILSPNRNCQVFGDGISDLFWMEL